LSIPTLRIKTDGSRVGGKSGCGILFHHSRYSSLNPQQFSTIYEDLSSLGSLATVFQAEVHAIIQALKYLVCISSPNQNKRVRFGPILSAHIFCDSQSALKALDSRLINSQQILECHNLLNAIGLRLEISHYRVKGHAGNTGKERAVVLA
jgi:ribonuclease HI